MQHTDEMHDEGMRDARESELFEERDQSAHEDHSAPSVVLDPNRKLGRGLIIGAIVVALLLGGLIVTGIHSRVHAEEKLTSSTKQDAILSVAVTTPSQGADALEITLPANTQAFIDTPIYARTNGYLRQLVCRHRHTRTPAGRYWPTLKLRNSISRCSRRKADLATAQANLQIAQITAERWKKLLAKNAVSQQEADQAISDFNARQSALVLGAGQRAASAAIAGL